MGEKKNYISPAFNYVEPQVDVLTTSGGEVVPDLEYYGVGTGYKWGDING